MENKSKGNKLVGTVRVVPSGELHTEPTNQGTYNLTCKHPYTMTWKPKPNITVYELALCLPYLLGRQQLYRGEEVSGNHFRHFEIY